MGKKIGQEEVIKIIRSFPNSIVEYATGWPPTPDNEKKHRLLLSKKMKAYQSAKYLLSLSCPISCSLYLNYIEKDQKLKRDKILENHIEDMVFQNKYNLGFASNVVQKIGRLEGEEFNLSIRYPAALTDFVQSSYRNGSSPQDPFIKKVNIYEKIFEMLKQISFLKQIEMKDDKILFRGKKIEFEPFIKWEDERLWRLDKTDLNGKSMTYLSRFGPIEEAKRITRELNPKELSSLKRIAKKIDSFEDYFSGEERMGITERQQSMIPLLADSHPAMTTLVDTLYNSADETILQRLWLDGKLEEEKNEGLYINNRIIEECLEEDPITVLEKFIRASHEHNFNNFLRALGKDQEEIKKIRDEVDKKVHNQVRDIKIFESLTGNTFSDEEEKLRRNQKAIRLAKEVGFNVVEPGLYQPLGTYVNVVKNLIGFEKEESKQLSTCIRHLSQIAEKILKLLVQFYNSVRYYEREKGVLGNISIKKISEKNKELVRNKGFGQMIGEFRELGKDDDIKSKLAEIVDRQSIWREDNYKEYFNFLNELNYWRNLETHHGGKTPAEMEGINLSEDMLLFDYRNDPVPTGIEYYGPKYLDKFLNWLIWLGGWEKNSFCIYPELLNLEVMTINRCGITTLQYAFQDVKVGERVLKSQTNKTRLYTKQNLNPKHSYFGIPHQKKTHTNLWVDPLLISTQVIQN